MISGTSTLGAAAVLAAVRAARAAENAAAAEVLAQAVAWAHLHPAVDPDEAATWMAGPGQDTGIPIAGEGAPLVSAFAVAEFATALGLSTESGRRLVGQALELCHRLPRIWAKVQAGQLPAWRARRIAEDTSSLSAEAAGFVDVQLAPFAHKTGVAQTQRLVEEAIARHMPDYARQRREQAADQRHVTVDHQQISFAGTVRVEAELDLVDGLDFEHAVAAGAAWQQALGCQDPLEVRRAAAVGILARGDHTLDLVTPVIEHGAQRPARDPDQAPTSAPGGDSALGGGATTGPGLFGRREVILYVHLSQAALRTSDPDAAVRVENAGGQLLTAGQIADWCRRPDTDRVIVKPVIDLNQILAVDGYQVPARIAEHVRLRDRTCVHPWCNRPARSCDLDHINPYVPIDDGGPPGQTSTDNLACLCRLHHRMKTHGDWTYTMIEPGAFLWRSPHGHTYLRDHTGTTDLTPPPADPPRRRAS